MYVGRSSPSPLASSTSPPHKIIKQHRLSLHRCSGDGDSSSRPLLPIPLLPPSPTITPLGLYDAVGDRVTLAYSHHQDTSSSGPSLRLLRCRLPSSSSSDNNDDNASPLTALALRCLDLALPPQVAWPFRGDVAGATDALLLPEGEEGLQLSEYVKFGWMCVRVFFCGCGWCGVGVHFLFPSLTHPPSFPLTPPTTASTAPSSPSAPGGPHCWPHSTNCSGWRPPHSLRGGSKQPLPSRPPPSCPPRDRGGSSPPPPLPLPPPCMDACCRRRFTRSMTAGACWGAWAVPRRPR